MAHSVGPLCPKIDSPCTHMGSIQKHPHHMIYLTKIDKVFKNRRFLLVFFFSKYFKIDSLCTPGSSAKIRSYIIFLIIVLIQVNNQTSEREDRKSLPKGPEYAMCILASVLNCHPEQCDHGNI